MKKSILFFLLIVTLYLVIGTFFSFPLYYTLFMPGINANTTFFYLTWSPVAPFFYFALSVYLSMLTVKSKLNIEDSKILPRNLATLTVFYQLALVVVYRLFSSITVIPSPLQFAISIVGYPALTYFISKWFLKRKFKK